MAFHLRNRELTVDDCRRYVRLYNAGYYPPARASNVEADARCYRLFEHGLASEPGELSRQLVFIGKNFGGAKVVPFERVGRAIGDRSWQQMATTNCSGSSPPWSKARCARPTSNYSSHRS